MATVQFPITVPDAVAGRVLNALRFRFGAGLSDAQAIEALRQQFIVTLEDLVFQAEKEAAEAAIANITRITAT